VRRFSALALASALVASTLFAFTGASALTPVGLAYPGDNGGGNLSTVPSTFSAGEPVQLYGNFASDQSGKVVTFYKETSSGSNDYTSVGTDAANSNGNAYLNGYTFSAAQKMFARSSTGKTTEIQTFTPTAAGPVTPNGPVTGSLAATPAEFSDGDTIQLGANFPNGTFPVEFYGEGPEDTWTKLATVQSNSYGNAYFKTYQVNGTQRVFARKSNNDRTEVDTLVPSAKTTLSIQRDCTGNDCTPETGPSTATASGVMDPVTEGVPVTLQWLNAGTWTTITPIGGPATTDAAGKVAIQFSLSGVPQWKARTYRLLANGRASNQILFMPGPSELGKNVLRVDVANGVYPVDKGPEYAAVATLSVNGTKTLDHVNVEEFGVRGSSTAKYTKKPYKLKFLDKPPSGTDVFGMPRAKSWTLLANYLDQTNIRNKVGLELGRRLKAHGNHLTWTPDSRFVEMFVNDQYRGAYQMTESVKIDKDRANVDETTGMIMDVDANKVEDPSIEFLATKSLTAFIFKDPDERNDADPKAVTGAKFTAIKNRINAFEAKLYSNTASVRDDYPDFLDAASTIDFYLIKEFTKDNDADFYKSHYFTWDQTIDVTDPFNPLQDGKFHFGPVWDFDRSAGNVDGDTDGHKAVRSPTGWYLRGIGIPSDSGRTRYKTHWFVQLFEDAGFKSAVKTRWNEVKAEFAKVHETETAAYAAELGVGAANDRNRWQSEPKRYASNGTFAQEIEYVTNWYQSRYNWIDDNM
jgi:hypothetical protein